MVLNNSKHPISAYTNFILNLRHSLRLGLRIDYDTLDPQTITDLVYVDLELNKKQEETRWETLFKGFAKMFNKILKAFR